MPITTKLLLCYFTPTLTLPLSKIPLVSSGGGRGGGKQRYPLLGISVFYDIVQQRNADNFLKADVDHLAIASDTILL
jgi:hypothetical protein